MKRLDQHAREYNQRAIETIVEVMEDPFAEDKDKLRAADMLLDRGNGKPISAVIQVPPSQQARALLSSMTDDELIGVLQRKALPRLADVQREQIVDAEFTEDDAVESDIDPLLL